MTDLTLRLHGTEDAAEVRGLLLEIYAEVYKDEADDPFSSVERFANGLDGWSSKPGWSCLIGYDRHHAVGYAYGAPLPENAAWWGGLQTDVPASETAENGSRTFALSELMVLPPWRKTGTAKAIHDALLTTRTEQRATLLVDRDHPRVRALYESWGWRWFSGLRPRIPHAPLFDAMLRNLP